MGRLEMLRPTSKLIFLEHQPRLLCTSTGDCIVWSNRHRHLELAAMNTYIDGRFERLEKALASLIDSVTKYHPSAVHAKELEAADCELSKGLGEGEHHHAGIRNPN